MGCGLDESDELTPDVRSSIFDICIPMRISIPIYNLVVGSNVAIRIPILRQARDEASRKVNLPLFTSERTLEIGPDGLHSEPVVGSRFVRWDFVLAVQETPSLVFIRLPMCGGDVIPKAVVPAETLTAFLAELRQHVAQ